MCEMAVAGDVTFTENGGNQFPPYVVAIVRWCVSYLWSTATVIMHRIATAPKVPSITAKPAAAASHIHPEPRVQCAVLRAPSTWDMDVIFVHGLYGSLENTWRQGDWRSKYKLEPNKVPLKRQSSIPDCCDSEQCVCNCTKPYRQTNTNLCICNKDLDIDKCLNSNFDTQVEITSVDVTDIPNINQDKNIENNEDIHKVDRGNIQLDIQEVTDNIHKVLRLDKTDILKEESKIDEEETKIYTEESKIYKEESKIYKEESKIYKEESEIYKEESKIVKEVTKTNTVQPKMDTEESKIHQEDSKIKYEPSQCSEETDKQTDRQCEVGCGCICDKCYSDCWPKDWLGIDFPNARIISINYTSDPYLWRPLWVKECKRLRLHERAKQMSSQLVSLGVGSKPVVWVGHSKGGLFIKQIYAEAYEAYLKLNETERNCAECDKDNDINHQTDAQDNADIDTENMQKSNELNSREIDHINALKNELNMGNFKELDDNIGTDVKLYENGFKTDHNCINNHISFTNGHVANINGQIPDVNGHIPDMNGHITDKDGHITDKEGHITNNDGHIIEKDSHITGINSNITDKDNNQTDINIENNQNPNEFRTIDSKQAEDLIENNDLNIDKDIDNVEELKKIASLWWSSAAFMFYSVPHRGSPLADIKTPITARSIELLEISKDCSLVLTLQDRWLRATRRRRPIVRSLVETSRTLMAVLWLRIVSVESADAGIGALCGVSVDHREICKPSSRSCILYTELLKLIHAGLHRWKECEEL